MLKIFGTPVRYGALKAALIMALSLTIALNGSKRLGAQVVVFDPSNYSQNLLTAARVLEQINNQVRGLENQAQSLLNQAKHLAGLPTSVVGQLSSTINQMNSLIAQA